MQGKIRGKFIEFDEEIGLADGQDVEVQVKVVQPTRTWGEGIARSAGGWADHPELDEVFERIYHDRKLERSPQMGNG